MTIYDFIHDHPDDHVRILRYVPAPDVLDERGNLCSGGEGTSTVVFDSTTGDGDFSFDLMPMKIIEVTDSETPDGDPVHDLEYMPDEYWY